MQVVRVVQGLVALGVVEEAANAEVRRLHLVVGGTFLTSSLRLVGIGAYR